MKLDRSALVNSLVLALAIGSGVAVLLTRERETTTEREARANNLFAQFPRQKLQRISLRRGDERLTLTRVANADAGAPGFMLDGAVPADADAVESLLRSLELAAYFKRFESADSDRSSLGLAQPQAELSLEFEGSRALLRVGKAAATPKDTSYVEVEAGGRHEIGLVRSSVLKELLISKEELRPRALLALSGSEVLALSFRDEKLAVELHRGLGPAWLDARGQRVRRDSVEHLLLELASAKLESFVDPARAAQLATPSLSIGVTPKSDAGALPSAGAPIAFSLGGSCPEAPKLSLVVRRDAVPLAGCVAAGLRDAFENAALELTDNGTFALHTDEVESLSLERGRDKLELMRNERGFLLLAPARADVALDAGNRRLDAILKASGEPLAMPDLGALGLSPPSGVVTARSSAIEGQKRFDEVLELGRTDAAGRLPVRRKADGRVLLLSRDAARAFAIDSTLLRTMKLFDFSPSQLKRLEIEWGSEHEVLVRNAGGELELTTPPHVTHDGALALDLLQALGTLSAVRWVADRDDGSFGLEHPSVVARLSVASGSTEKLFTLRVGASTPGGAFATLDSEPGVFIIERDVVEPLTTLLYTRGAFMSDPATLARIDLERRGARVTLTRQGEQFRAQPALPDAIVGSLVENIANLRAEAAVHSGPARPGEGFDAPTLSVRLTAKAPKQPARNFRIGARDTYRDGVIYYGRVDGIDATFALPLASVKKLLEAL